MCKLQGNGKEAAGHGAHARRRARAYDMPDRGLSERHIHHKLQLSGRTHRYGVGISLVVGGDRTFSPRVVPLNRTSPLGIPAIARHILPLP